MRLEGFEGLAVAITKQAAHDYCECLRWMRDHAEPGVNTQELIDFYTEERKRCKSHGARRKFTECTRQIKKYKAQSAREVEIADIEDWMHSDIFHMISEIDGDELLTRIQEQLKKDPKFRVLLGDDF